MGDPRNTAQKIANAVAAGQAKRDLLLLASGPYYDPSMQDSARWMIGEIWRLRELVRIVKEELL